MIPKIILALVLGVGVDPVKADPPKELSSAAKGQLKLLEGKWRVERFLFSDRETIPETEDDAPIVAFKDGTIDFNGSVAATVFELDPSTNPKCFDFKAVTGAGLFRKGTVYESVYKLDGDTLTWAVYTGRGKNRPVVFDKPTDDGFVVMVLNRVKE
jgi:uncharacterized protein (TIGR03067 family)